MEHRGPEVNYQSEIPDHEVVKMAAKSIETDWMVDTKILEWVRWLISTKSLERTGKWTPTIMRLPYWSISSCHFADVQPQVVPTFSVASMSK